MNENQHQSAVGQPAKAPWTARSGSASISLPAFEVKARGHASTRKPPESGPPRSGPGLLVKAVEGAAAAGFVEVVKWILSGGWRFAQRPAR